MDRLLSKILDNTDDALIYIDKNSCVKIFNSKAQKTLNISYENAINKNISSIIPNARLPYILKTGKKEYNQLEKINSKKILISRFPVILDGTYQGALAVFREFKEISSKIEVYTEQGKINSIIKHLVNSNQKAMNIANFNGERIYENNKFTEYMHKFRSTFLKNEFENKIEDQRAKLIIEGETINEQIIWNENKFTINTAKVFISEKNFVFISTIDANEKLSDIRKELKLAKNKIKALENSYSIFDIKGSNPAVNELLEKALQAANSSVNILIEGENGTEKRKIALSIHEASSRKNFEFITINCYGKTPEQLEKDLFGYRDFEGNFINGAFVKAQNSTLYIAGVECINLATQIKILRIIEEKMIYCEFTKSKLSLNCRLICSSMLDLKELVNKNEFRQELYYRLKLIPLLIPPLRNRLEDLEILSNDILDKICSKKFIEKISITKEALARMSAYSWKNNIYELYNYLERVVLSLDNGVNTIEKKHLRAFATPLIFEEKLYKEPFDDDFKIEKLSTRIKKIERDYIENVLDYYAGNKKKAAEKLGVSMRTIYNKLEDEE